MTIWDTILPLRAGEFCPEGVITLDDSICSAEFSEGCKHPASDEANEPYQRI
jgi:hypothetical protein